MKSCCFAGDKDQFILSGSDDFNLYMWKIPERSKYESEIQKICFWISSDDCKLQSQILWQTKTDFFLYNFCDTGGLVSHWILAVLF